MKKPLPKPPAFPMRVNKFLAMKGYATRRGADDLVAKRWVTINGKVAVLGDKVRNNKKAGDYQYFAYYKPRGIATEKIEVPREIFPVLGLDAQAEGLVLFANDRRLIERLSNAAHAHEKEYFIKTVQEIRPTFKEKMEQGVTIAGSAPIHAKVSVRGDKSFILKMTDNGTHIRQMCSMFFTEIESLTRTRILNIELAGLKPEGHREIKDDELAVFLKSLGL